MTDALAIDAGGVAYPAVTVGPGGVVYPVAIGADGAPCCCGGDPGTPARCYLVCMRCDSPDPTELYLFEPEAVFAAGFDYQVGKVIGLSNGVCLAIQGYYNHPGGPLPDLFSTFPGNPPSVIAVHQDCLASPCGLAVSPDCPGCIAPNLCLGYGPLPGGNPWFATFGANFFCAGGAVVICSLRANGQRLITSEGLTIEYTETERLRYSAQSMSLIYGTSTFVQHSFQASGTYFHEDTRQPGSGFTEDLSSSVSISNPTTQAQPFALWSVSRTPFNASDLPNGPANGNPDARIGAMMSDVGDVESSWAGAGYTGQEEHDQTSDSGTVTCSRVRFVHQASHSATISPWYGSASFSYRRMLRWQRDNHHCTQFEPFKETDDIDMTLTESRSVLWFLRPADLPDFGPGCPIIVRAYKCDDFAVTVFVDIKDFLPVPGAVAIDYEGEETRFYVEPIIVSPGDDTVYTPILAYESCTSSISQPPADPYRLCQRCPVGQLPGYPTACRVPSTVPAGVSVRMVVATPGQPTCTTTLWFVTTAQTTADDGLPVGSVVAGDPCTQTDAVNCPPPDGPNVQPGGSGAGEPPQDAEPEFALRDPRIRGNVDRQRGPCIGCGDQGLGGY